MENLIVATFKDLQNANGALDKLKNLDYLDDIVLYNIVLVRKSGDSQFEFLYRYGSDTEDLPAGGAVIGSLVGLLAGPIGMAIGMMTGAMVGAVDEDDTDSFLDEVSKKVNKVMLTGDYAIVADLEEDIDLLVDTYLDPFHAVIIRTSLNADYAIYDELEWDELDKEIDDAGKKLAAAKEADKAAIKDKLDKLKAKREERKKKARSRWDSFKSKMQDKKQKLDAKIATTEGKQKEKFKDHKEKIEARLKKWNEKVSSAFA